MAANPYQRDFNPSKPLTVLRAFKSHGRNLVPGDEFIWMTLGIEENIVRRLFDTRYLGHMDPVNMDGHQRMITDSDNKEYELSTEVEKLKKDIKKRKEKEKNKKQPLVIGEKKRGRPPKKKGTVKS